MKELQTPNHDVVLGNDTLDEATSRGDMHVEHHLNTLENQEVGKKLEEAELPHSIEEEFEEAESLNSREAECQGPLEEKKYEMFKEECKVEEQLAQVLGASSNSQLMDKSSQGIILDPTLVTFPSSCNLGKKKYLFKV